MKKNIFQELEILKGQQIISPEQYQQLYQYYLVEQQKETQASSARFIPIVAIIGSVLIGVGLLLLVGTNWDYLSDALKTVLLITVMLAIYGVGLYMYAVQDYPKIGQALILLGSFAYGANIFLLGQIYNMGGSYVEAFGIWALGTVPLAYATRFPTILTLGVGTATVFLFSQIFDAWGIDPSIYFSLVTFVVTILFGVLMVGSKDMFKKVYMGYFFIGTLVTSIGHAIILGDTSSVASAFIGLGLCGLVLVFGSGFLPSLTYKGLRLGLMGEGYILLISALYLLIYDWYSFDAIAVPISLLYLLGVCLIVMIIKYMKQKLLPDLLPIISFFFLACMTVALWLQAGDFIYVSATIFFLLFVVGFVYMGVQKNSPLIINTGIVCFVIFVITKYIDLFYDMMSGGLFFVIGGVVLLTGGYFLEKTRKKLLGKK